MSQKHKTATCFRCIYCGAKKRLCEECNKYFYAKRENHVICSTRCRTRKYRRIKKEKTESPQL